MDKTFENMIDRETEILLTDRDIMSKNIKSTCKMFYEKGYKDGFNEGFKWNLVKDKLPSNNEDKIVATDVYFDNYNGNDGYTIVETGYYHNGEWFVNGRPLYFNGDYGEKVIAWADFPTKERVFIWKILKRLLNLRIAKTN